MQGGDVGCEHAIAEPDRILGRQRSTGQVDDPRGCGLRRCRTHEVSGSEGVDRAHHDGYTGVGSFEHGEREAFPSRAVQVGIGRRHFADHLVSRAPAGDVHPGMPERLLDIGGATPDPPELDPAVRRNVASVPGDGREPCRVLLRHDPANHRDDERISVTCSIAAGRSGRHRTAGHDSDGDPRRKGCAQGALVLADSEEHRGVAGEQPLDGAEQPAQWAGDVGAFEREAMGRVDHRLRDTKNARPHAADRAVSMDDVRVLSGNGATERDHAAYISAREFDDLDAGGIVADAVARPAHRCQHVLDLRRRRACSELDVALDRGRDATAVRFGEVQDLHGSSTCAGGRSAAGLCGSSPSRRAARKAKTRAGSSRDVWSSQCPSGVRRR